MTDKICSFCGDMYDLGKGHDYDKCVEVCQETYNHCRTQVENWEWRLARAREVQKQDYWRKA